LIVDYLTNRQQYVSYNGGVSSMRDIEYGVSQGSILGPLLFLLYVNDIDTVCQYLHFLLFADDTNILYTNSDVDVLFRVANSELLKLSDWFKANKLSLNVQKTNYIMFGYKKIESHATNDDLSYSMIIDSVVIEKVNHVKFFGTIIDDKLSWHKHISNAELKLSRALHSMSRLRHKLNRSCRLTLYYSLIYSHLNYCTMLWGSASKTALSKLLLLQKRAVRIIDNFDYRSHTDPLYKKYNL
jgi:hypothetical protein